MKTYKRKTGIWHYLGKNKEYYCCIEKSKTLTFGTCDKLFKPKYVVSFKKQPQLYYVGSGKISTPNKRFQYFESFINKGNQREYNSKVYLQKKGKSSHFTKLFIRMARKNRKGFKNKINATKLKPVEYLFAVRNKVLFRKIPLQNWSNAVKLIMEDKNNFELFKKQIFDEDMKNLLK